MPASEQAYFERSLFNRLTLRQRVKHADGRSRIVYLRLTDFDSNLPSWKSVRRLPWILYRSLLDRGNPLSCKSPAFPWLPVDAVEFLAVMVRPGWRVLEVGGGNSTLWFAAQRMSVITIEHDERWVEMIGRALPQSADVRLHVAAGQDAIQLIEAFGDEVFDLALIDSASAVTDRALALQAALPKIKRGGHIVLDDSDFPHVKPALAVMRRHASKVFTGYVTRGVSVGQTTVWQV